jgi:hypothetical protein
MLCGIVWRFESILGDLACPEIIETTLRESGAGSQDLQDRKEPEPGSSLGNIQHHQPYAAVGHHPGNPKNPFTAQ